MDTYDTLVSERPYEKSRGHGEAIRMIQQEREMRFDPQVVDVFLQIYAVRPVPVQSTEAA